MAKRDSDGIIPNPVNRKLAESVSQPQQSSSAPMNDHRPPSRRKPKRDVERKTYFHDDELRLYDHIVDQLGEAIGIRRLPWSIVNRALWAVLQESVRHQKGMLNSCPQLDRPANGDSLAMEEFEAEFQQIIRRILRTPYR